MTIDRKKEVIFLGIGACFGGFIVLFFWLNLGSYASSVVLQPAFVDRAPLEKNFELIRLFSAPDAIESAALFLGIDIPNKNFFSGGRIKIRDVGGNIEISTSAKSFDVAQSITTKIAEIFLARQKSLLEKTKSMNDRGMKENELREKRMREITEQIPTVRKGSLEEVGFKTLLYRYENQIVFTPTVIEDPKIISSHQNRTIDYLLLALGVIGGMMSGFFLVLSLLLFKRFYRRIANFF